MDSDPLAQCRLAPDDFAALMAAVLDWAPQAVVGLEGGYSADMGAALAASLDPALGGDLAARTAAARKAAAKPESSGSSTASSSSHGGEEERVALCPEASLPPKGGLRRFKGVVVCVDAAGVARAVSARLPPVGLPTCGFGDFDPNVRTVRDRATGTKFYVDSGDVRGCVDSNHWFGGSSPNFRTL